MSKEHADRPGEGAPKGSFREKAISYFYKALGQPEEIPVSNGKLFRWRLPRVGENDVMIYITINSPELPNIAHIMVTDPAEDADEPIKNFVLRDLSALDAVLAYIRARSERVRPVGPDVHKPRAQGGAMPNGQESGPNGLEAGGQGSGTAGQASGAASQKAKN